MVARISAHTTRPLERATYQGILPIGQLPPVLVCDSVVVDCDDVVEVGALVPPVVVVAPLDVLPVLAAAAVDDVVVALWPSRQASAPPSESIVATLRAVAALRARAARGFAVRGWCGERAGEGRWARPWP